MSLQSPPFDADIYRFADWLELKILASSTNEIFFSDIERAWEARREAEDDDFEGCNTDFDVWLTSVCGEIEARKKSLNAAYPFNFNSDDSGFELTTPLNDITVGSYIYIFCLMLSTIGETQVFEEDIHEITPRMRDLFQACSAWAASGVINGCAYAFGWPRPENDNFLTALRVVYHDLFGEGRVVDQAPPGASLQEKDGGIDVIAWAPRPDMGPGQPYLIGQVASGRNWQEKSVKQYIDPLNQNWFTRSPRSVPQPAMFIPFCIIPRGEASVRDQLDFYTPLFGNIYYRLVLPHYAALGLNRAANEGIFVHRQEDLPKIKSEVVEFLAELTN